MDNNEGSLGIFFELAKAFDAVDHNIPSLCMAKPERYDIRDEALEWCKNDFVIVHKRLRAIANF